MVLGKFALAALLVVSASAVHAQNIVGNPGFETGSFPPWVAAPSGGISMFPDAAPTRVHTGGRSGSFAATNTPGSGTLQQTLTTIGLQAYTLDFWVRDENTSFPAGTDAVTVSWDGALLATLNLAKDSTHHEFTFAVQASGTSTVLQFGSPVMSTGGSGLWRINLDDVSVTPGVAAAATPEPGSLALLLTSSLTGAGLIVRHRRKTRKTA